MKVIYENSYLYLIYQFQDIQHYYNIYLISQSTHSHFPSTFEVYFWIKYAVGL